MRFMCFRSETYEGPPSEALLPGSRLPQALPSEQHGLFVPQKGPAAQAAQPMYWHAVSIHDVYQSHS
jgi:hypothetical protein